MKFNYTNLLTAFAAALTLHQSSMAVLTATEELDLTKGTVPLVARQTSAIVWPVGMNPLGSEFNQATMGTATITGTSLFSMDDAGYIYAMLMHGTVSGNVITYDGVWRTFRSVDPITTALTTTSPGFVTTGNVSKATITLKELVRNGVTDPGGASAFDKTDFFVIGLELTAGTTSLTPPALRAFLRNCTQPNTGLVASLTAPSLLTAGGPLFALPTGWIAKAYVGRDTDGEGSGALAAIAASLAPVEVSITAPLTTAAGTVLAYRGSVPVPPLNVTDSSAALLSYRFSGQDAGFSGSTLDLSLKPNLLNHTKAISVSILEAFNTLTGRILSATDGSINVFTLSKDINARLHRLITPSALSVPLDVRLSSECAAPLVADFLPYGATDVTTAANPTYMLLSLGTDITGVTFRGEGTKLIASGATNSGLAKDFECDFDGMLQIDATHNAVLTFKAKDGDTFFIKTFAAAGDTENALDTAGLEMNDHAKSISLVNQMIYVLDDGATSVSPQPVTTIKGFSLEALVDKIIVTNPVYAMISATAPTTVPVSVALATEVVVPLLGNAKITKGDVGFTSATNTDYELVALGAGISVSSWLASDAVVVAKVGTKSYVLNLAGKTEIYTGTNDILTFVAGDGSAFFVKSYAISDDKLEGADGSALATALVGVLSGVTTISGKTVAQLVDLVA